ncbi:MAG: alpha/beta fold hydrolase [Actinomycetota bacterium]
MKIRAMLVVTLLIAMPFAPRAANADTITRLPVSFTVTNPADPLHGTYTVRGFLMRPTGCTSSVLLALHGLSYGQWAWDFPLKPAKYSVARALAERGHAMIAIDELGYGQSAGVGAADHPNGYTLSVESYADITSQIISQIRSGSYAGVAHPAFGHVGLIGHSAGSEIAELTTGLHPDLVDALIATSYTHVPFVSTEWLQREWSQDNLRAAQSDYEEFEQGVRPQDMYNLSNADPAVVAKDMSLANLTPSGEVFSIGSQPARALLPPISKPVLVVLGGKDTLFPGTQANGDNEMLHFAGTTDKTLKLLPNDGHVFMLHTDAPAANAAVSTWLEHHAAAMPGC